MSRPTLTTLIVILAAALSLGCASHAESGSGAPSSVPPSAASGATADPPDETSLPTRWVAPRVPDDVSVLAAPAIVRAADARGEVSAAVRLRVVRLHTRVGARVDIHDPIVDVASPELLDAAATYVGAGRGARAHVARATELDALSAEGLTSRSEVFSARANASTLATERDRAAALLRAADVDPQTAPQILRNGHFTLRAPVAGVVTLLSARVGEIREPGNGALAEIVGEGAPRIEVRTTSAWPTATAVTFEASDGRLVALTASPIASVIDPDDGTRISWYAPAEPCALPDGLTGSARVTRTDAVWEVPITAVTQRSGASVMLRRRGETTTAIPVRVLSSGGTSALVRGDLATSDTVAADITGRALPPIETPASEPEPSQ